MKTKEEIRAQLKALEKEYKQAAQTEFKVGLKELFDEFPAVKVISWTQYTPHFNDGDECTFSSHHEYPAINGNDEDYGDDSEIIGEDLLKNSNKTIGWGADEKPNPDYSADAVKAVKAVKKFLGAFDDDAYEEMFGDHVQVTCTRKGIKVEEYEHD